MMRRRHLFSLINIYSHLPLTALGYFAEVPPLPFVPRFDVFDIFAFHVEKARFYYLGGLIRLFKNTIDKMGLPPLKFEVRLILSEEKKRYAKCDIYSTSIYLCI